MLNIREFAMRLRNMKTPRILAPLLGFYVKRAGTPHQKDIFRWWTFRDSYKEGLVREIKGIRSCLDCIFRWWSEECVGCDRTPRNWGGSDEEDVELAKRMLSDSRRLT